MRSMTDGGAAAASAGEIKSCAAAVARSSAATASAAAAARERAELEAMGKRVAPLHTLQNSERACDHLLFADFTHRVRA